jgi:hypothetical protein
MVTARGIALLIGLMVTVGAAAHSLTTAVLRRCAVVSTAPSRPKVDPVVAAWHAGISTMREPVAR